MVHYSFQELEDGLNLPADAIETSPKIIGKVMMLGIAKAIMGDWSYIFALAINRDWSKEP